MTVKISVLGDFRVSMSPSATADDTSHPISIGAQKNKALLAWLACHADQPQPRERLADLLWPDHEPSNAKASLRQAVAGLKKALPEHILLTEDRTLSLNQARITLDLEVFRSWRDSADLTNLRSALNAYEGDLLDGFNARSEVFDEWLLLEREALRREALAGLQHLMEQEQSTGDLASAVTSGGRLLALDPLQEAVHRNLMRLYAELGQLGSAQRQFRLCRDVLARELSTPPAPDTVALFNSLGQLTAQPARPEAADATEAQATHAEPATTDRRAALPNIAVLPFRTLSTVPEHEYLADGMTEELINLLTSSANWRVAARNLSFQYKDQQPDIRQVGVDLGAAYVVEGSIRTLGERVRISCALVSTADGTQIWSNRYDRPLADLFEIQDEAVHAIFRSLKNRLGFAERERVRRTPKTNLDAWGLLIKAMQVNVVDRRSHEEQLQTVREALRIESNYARAHAYLASLLFTAVGRGTSPDPQGYANEAGEHMEIALDGSPSDPVVLKMCAGGFAAIGRAQQALSLAERAFELSGAPDPLLVAVLMWNGRLDEAITYAEEIVAAIPQGVTLPPGELRPLALLGNLYMLKGDYPAALALTLKDQRMNPGNYFAHVNTANLYGLLGQDEEAAKNWQLAIAIVPTLTVALFAIGYRHVFDDSDLADKFSAGLVAAGLG